MKKLLGAIGLSAAIALTLTACGGSTSAFHHYRILLVGHGGGGSRIFVWHPGSPLKALTPAAAYGIADSTGGPYGYSGGSWSPDGRSIAFEVDYLENMLGPVYGDIRVTRSDGSHAKVKDGPSWPNSPPLGLSGKPNWSPDGRQIVYKTEIYVDAELITRQVFSIVDVSSGRAHNVPADAATGDPVWGKPGIAYQEGSKIMLLNPKTGRSRLLTHGFADGTLAWSPRSVLAIVEPTRIVLLGASGRVLGKIPVPAAASPVCAIAWSPDGNQILAATAQDKWLLGLRQLWVETVSTKRWQRLPRVPRWSNYTYDCGAGWR